MLHVALRPQRELAVVNDADGLPLAPGVLTREGALEGDAVGRARPRRLSAEKVGVR